MPSLLHALSNHPIFGKLSPVDLENMVKTAIRRSLTKREILGLQNDYWPYVVYVYSGHLRWVLLSSRGKEHQLYALPPGEVFWAHSFFDDEPLPATLIAGKNSVIYLWSRETLLPILYRNPNVMFEVMRMLVRIMRQAREIIYGLSFQPVASRLARFLLICLEESDTPVVRRNMTLEEMAKICGSSPEVICRLLYQFQMDGVVDISRSQIVIHDVDALRKLASTE